MAYSQNTDPSTSITEIPCRESDSRCKLLGTAIELIWDSNYASVGVNSICKQAGVTKGCFYHHFESKADLFAEASDYHWAQTRQKLDAIFSPSYSPLEQLQNYLDFILGTQNTGEGADENSNENRQNPVSGCPFFTAGAQVCKSDIKVRQASQQMTDKSVAYNTALVRNLKATNHLFGNPDPLQVGRMLSQYVQGLLIYGQVYQDLDMVKRDLSEGIYRLLGLKTEFWL